MNRVELEGVLAHELSHISNNDILVSARWPSPWSVASRWSRHRHPLHLVGWRAPGRRPRRQQPGRRILALVGFLLLILAPLIAKVMQAAMSRSRESLADVSAVQLTRYPPGLISALEKLPRRHDGDPLGVQGHGPPLDRAADGRRPRKRVSSPAQPPVRHAPPARGADRRAPGAVRPAYASDGRPRVVAVAAALGGPRRLREQRQDGGDHVDAPTLPPSFAATTAPPPPPSTTPDGSTVPATDDADHRGRPGMAADRHPGARTPCARSCRPSS